MRSQRPLTVRVLAGVAATAAALAGFASIAPAASAAEAPVHIADTNASAQTRSLFSYLDATRGTSALFGHQHTTDNGITFTGPADGVQSDVKAAVGDYPAVFGFDTLILEGREAPGKPTNTPEQNIAAFRTDLEQAHRLGGISTISAHMMNFATGNDFHDAGGRTASHILPGGDKNAVFNQYLDRIAELAKTTVDDSGNPIPLIFRPFHENTGTYFWWGSANTTPGEYKELFRYTVEYLRDTKGVSNLLYAYSPGGSGDGDSAKYLATYPGDAWTDILGYDAYENSNDAPDSSAWIKSTVTDLAMISKLADEHGKISALTEFGRNGDRTIKASGNKSLHYFTDLIAAIKADPDARRIAYMMTWSNWSLDEFYVPYPAYGDKPANELLPDFRAFHDDPYTGFAADLPPDVYTRTVSAAPADPTLRIVTPADGVRVTTPTTTVRVKATTAVPTAVSFTVGSDPEQHPLVPGDDGTWSADWAIGAAALTNQASSITVHATYADGSTLETTSALILGAARVLPVGTVDDFEGYGDDAALQSAYAFNNASASDLTLTSTTTDGSAHAAQFAYDFTARAYGGFGKSFPSAQDWSHFTDVKASLTPDGSNQKLVFQFKAGGATFEAYPSLAGVTPTDLSIPLTDFHDKSDATKSPTAAQLASVSEFYVFINQVGAPRSGSIGLDDIRATTADSTSPTPPGSTNPPSSGGGGPVGADPGSPTGGPAASTAVDPGEGSLAFTGTDAARLAAMIAGGLALIAAGIVLVIRPRRRS